MNKSRRKESIKRANKKKLCHIKFIWNDITYNFNDAQVEDHFEDLENQIKYYTLQASIKICKGKPPFTWFSCLNKNMNKYKEQNVDFEDINVEISPQKGNKGALWYIVYLTLPGDEHLGKKIFWKTMKQFAIGQNLIEMFATS